MKQPAVYILASALHGTLYVGLTSNLVQRIWQHKQEVAEGFTRKYRIHQLVYYELHADMTAAIVREKQIKTWRRARKIQMIERATPLWRGNPLWRDLYDEILGAA